METRLALDELERLAKGVLYGCQLDNGVDYCFCTEYEDAVTPEVIIKLIATLRRYRQELDEIANGKHSPPDLCNCRIDTAEFLEREDAIQEPEEK